jgi:hypothetical protein
MAAQVIQMVYNRGAESKVTDAVVARRILAASITHADNVWPYLERHDPNLLGL